MGEEGVQERLGEQGGEEGGGKGSYLKYIKNAYKLILYIHKIRKGAWELLKNSSILLLSWVVVT